MLYSKLSGAAFCSLVSLFLLLPFTSYQHTLPVFPAAEENEYADVSRAGAFLLNRHAVEYVNNYIARNNEDLSKIRSRSQRSFATIETVFKKYKLPGELKYLAVIESELKSTAVSPVGAAGVWQLMPETARLLGLEVTDKNDERKQFGKSTKAAALYLRDLHTEFDDWLLVISAYNCGPGPVYTAIRKSGSRNFWKLQRYLPSESREHVKKFIATHYYFEGKGSETTLTRAENNQRRQAIDSLDAMRRNFTGLFGKREDAIAMH
ncbi:MAG: lytic transglycosylase domain-containing protein [Bacteroidota bacterium]|nr:lytic transglycosylase domain-containing protein [Bacteroidota bacterium]